MCKYLLSLGLFAGCSGPVVVTANQLGSGMVEFSSGKGEGFLIESSWRALEKTGGDASKQCLSDGMRLPLKREWDEVASAGFPLVTMSPYGEWYGSDHDVFGVFGDGSDGVVFRCVVPAEE